ncbi:hypothetical protein HELRODRAFT_70319 [Helobdella robusta]|uniref:TLC domain-containing protein n=1 Tax=Helobdella robusta TaxID=6412 RepID=T1G046_HELRO|nr:hypothetical protein HELRODRAFT_70319 [Helobdella robusta]ESN91306.1 hypothetical protein HELRODRAFT_70319 [Helobdella robusta]
MFVYNCTYALPYNKYFHLIKPLKKNEFHCRVVTLMHAVVVVLASAWSIFINRSWPYSSLGGSSTNLQIFVCIFSLGYFLFDFAWCLYHRAEGFVMLFHHCLTMLGLWVTLFREAHGSEIIATIFFAEITNPLLQIRCFQKDVTQNMHNKLNDSKHVAKNIAVIDFLFFTLFTIMRLVLGSHFLIMYLSSKEPDVLARAGCICIYAISWLFWVQMVKYIKKTYFQKEKND